MKRFISYITAFSMLFVLAGCVRELLQDGTDFGKGESKVSLVLDFKPMSVGLERTKAAGDALTDITSLYVLLYDFESKTLKTSWKIENYSLSDVNRTDGEAENGHSAESETKQAKFTLDKTVAYGKYYMYAVANIDNLLTDYSENIRTIDGLKSLPLTWDSADISKNAQMMGCVTANGFSSADESIILNKQSTNLHAWLRRAASKVTVAFDGSALKEGVFIYIKSVQIKDIPKQCYLGKDNNVGALDYTLDKPSVGPDMPDGEIVYYHPSDSHDKSDFGDECSEHRISSGSPKFGSGHGEYENALYFFENMQGAGDSMPDKRQDADGNGVLDHPGLPGDGTYRLKDDVPYGTYIEVKAHYVSVNTEKLGNGPITYRFMLGQTEKKDYNAKRNCHYKLTLKFRNFANDADWHIEYVEPDPGVILPEPYFISYLYNHSCMYPIKINTGGRTIEYVEAKIIDNPWAPYGSDGSIYWNKNNVDRGDLYPWNGFLSLHKTVSTIIGGVEDASLTANKSYYEAAPHRGKRKYTDFDLQGETSKEFSQASPVHSDDKYVVTKDPDEPYTYTVSVPLYTRAKQLVSKTGYTGNNPYVAYQRHAKVEFTVKLSDLPAFVDTVTIKQVRRVVNPKGIYRSSGNDRSFHVQLLRLPKEDTTHFVPFQSEGEWKAYVIENYNGTGITLSGTSGVSEVRNGTYKDVNGNEITGDVIYGKTGSFIDFNVDFSSGDYTGNRYAVIRVEYHNCSCYHLIFVRQGNEPDDLLEGGTKWYAENMRTKGSFASTPLDEGSLFKFGNWEHPIDAMSNKNSKPWWINVKDTDFKAPDKLLIAGTTDSLGWTSIESSGVDAWFVQPDIAGVRVATFDDYWALKQSDLIELGYGVMYGDDADKCADNIIDAYEYDYEHNTSGRGIRGCFAYNKTTGKSLFFPIGASGYGHRKQSYEAKWGNPEKLDGVLRYACGRTTYFPTPDALPLFYDIFRRPGAIYWFDRMYDKGNKEDGSFNGLGWDINYFTFDFNCIPQDNMIRYDSNNQFIGSDACFVRCVQDNTP